MGHNTNKVRARPDVDRLVDRLLTPAEAGDEDHLATGERFVRRLIAERRIRFVKCGKFVRIPESAVAEFIEAGMVEARR